MLFVGSLDKIEINFYYKSPPRAEVKQPKKFLLYKKKKRWNKLLTKKNLKEYI